MISAEIADQLLQQGQISQETYAKIMSQAAPPTPQPPAMPSPSPTPPATTMPAPDLSAPPTPEPVVSRGATGSWDAPATPPPAEPTAPAAPEPMPELPSERDMLLDSVRQVESSGGKNLIGPMTKFGQAKGPYQLMDATGQEVAQKLGIQNYDPMNEEQSRQIAGAYLDQNLQKYGGNKALALAAYNAGPGRVDEALKAAGGDPVGALKLLPQETQDYVPKVLGYSPAVEERPKTPEGMVVKGYEDQRKAVQQAAELGVQKAEADAAYAQTMQKELDSMAAQREAQQKLIQDKLAEAEAVRNKLKDEYFATPPTDQGRWWSSMGTWEKLGTAIGAALLGTLVSPGVAISMISGMVERDINQQRQDALLRKEKFEKAETLYGQLLNQGKDASTAYFEAKATALQFAQKRLTEYAAPFKSQEIQNKALELSGQMDVKIGEFLNEAAKRRSEALKNQMDSPAMQQQMMQGVLDGAFSPDALPKDLRERYVPGFGFATDPTTAREAQGQAAGFQTAIDNINKTLQLRQEEGGAGSILEPLDRERLRSLYGPLKMSIAANLKQAFKLGTLDAGVERLIAMGFPTEEELLSYDRSAVGGESPVVMKLNQMKATMAEQMAAELSSKIPQVQPQGRNAVTEMQLQKQLRPGRAPAGQ